MKRFRMKMPVTRWFTQYGLPIATLWVFLGFEPVIMGQHVAGGHSGAFSAPHVNVFSGPHVNAFSGPHVNAFSGPHVNAFSGPHVNAFSGPHVGWFTGGYFHRGYSAPGVFKGFSGPAPGVFHTAPRMNWTAPRSSFAPERRDFAGDRPTHRAWNHGENHRDRYRRRYRGDDDDDSYPYFYVNSWELLPGDLDYSDFTGYGNDYQTGEPDNAQADLSAQQQQAPPEDQYRPQYAPAPYQPSPAYEPPAPTQPPANQTAASSPLHAQPELTLIFKDGHTQNIHNYMLTPREVIVTDDAGLGRIPRIPLSDLNIPATQKAAQQAGLEFSPPSA